jgi:hypothetical protein
VKKLGSFFFATEGAEDTEVRKVINPKHEIRNPKQILNPKTPILETGSKLYFKEPRGRKKGASSMGRSCVFVSKIRDFQRA